MRFSRLSLHKYGHFDDCDLHFPKGELDFHVVFGSNEAGKSTTLSAAGDLLFGFPHGRAYDFRHDASLLRVGALLEDGKASLAVRRRRGNQNTLLDDAGLPVQEAALHGMLRGRSAEEFRTHFSLDHARLREGGRAMVDARGDLAQTVFAAGSGILHAQALLRDLQAEADAIWSPSRTRSTCKQAARDLAEAESRVKAALRKPRLWEKARDLRDGLVEARAKLEGERANHQSELRCMARRRALAVPVRQRANLLAEMAGLSAPAFDTAQEHLYEQTAQAITAAEIKLRAAEAAIAETTGARAAIEVDHTMLHHREAIDTLVATAGAAGEAERDLPGIEAELREALALSDRLIRDLGLAPGPPDVVLDRLPSPALLADLQDRATARQKLDTRLEEVREQLKLDRTALAQAQADLRALCSPPIRRTHTLALRRAQMAVAIAARLRERRRAVASTEKTLAAALQRLQPWSGSTQALAEVSPPAEGDVESAETAMLAAATAADDERRTLQRCAEKAERLALEMREVTASRRAVTSAELAAIREHRASAWAPLHAHIAAGGVLPDPHGAVAAYESAVKAADSLADERFETAADSARLTELGVGIELARLDVSQAQSRLASVQAVLEQRRQAWHAMLAAAGLPAMTPASARQWRTDQADALKKAEALLQAELAEADDQVEVQSARVGLAGLLSDHGAAPDDAASFTTVLDQAQALMDEAAAAASQRSALEAKVKSAEGSVAVSGHRIEELSVSVQNWALGWAEAGKAAGLTIAPGSTATLLPLFEQLRGKLGAAATLQRRIAGIARRRLLFDAEMFALAAACGAADVKLDAQVLTEQLRLRLAGALSDERAAQDLDELLRRKREEYRDARHSIEAAAHLLAPLMQMAGLPDRTGLAGAVQAARTAREMRGRLQELERFILDAGDGDMLEALLSEAEAADPVWLGQETARLQSLIDGLNLEIEKADRAVGEASHAFDALNVDSNEAALAAADQAQARAALQAEAEAYLAKRAQAVMLARAVDEYRKRHEDPLLGRASALFSRLTLGRYSKLDIDRSAEKPRLVGICSNGSSLVPVEGMSDGTADQLFLALRLSRLEQLLGAGVVLPFLADDLFINFDDQRAHAGFRVLGEVARRTQVLFFTHHEHLRAIAQDALGPHTVSLCELAAAA